MALVLKDRVKETTTTTGTGTITLAGAVVGYQSFSVIGDSNTTYYVIEDANNAWEVGIGTYTLSGTTLARTTVLGNSSGNTSAITLSSGTHAVFCTYPAGKSVNLDASGNLSHTVALTTDTSGNYVATVTGGTGITSTGGTSGEGVAHSLSVDVSQTQITGVGTITTGTWAATDVAILHGGTGSSTAGGARTNLGVDAAGTDNSTDVTLATVTGNYLGLAGQVITAGNVPATLGGTGLTSISTLLNSNVTPTSLSLVVGTNVQAWDAQLDTLATWTAAQVTTIGNIGTITTAADMMIYTTAADTFAETSITTFGRSILDDADEAAFKATVNLEIGTDVQAYDADLAAIAGLASTDSNFIVGSAGGWVAESGATARTSLGVDAAGTDNSTDVTLAGTLDYITIVGQTVTRNAIDLAADVTGTLPVGSVSTITLGTNTAGNYVGTVTGGTGITSTGATTGEGIAHSLSVDASQTQITSVGTIGVGTWNGSAIGASYLPVLNSITAPTGDVSLNSHKITSLTDPTAAQDAATKSYVDAIKSGLDIKDSCVAATTAAGTLATSFENGDVIDGVTLVTNERILIKDQSTGSENGIYKVNASGAPTRATDFDEDSEVTAGVFTFIEEGTANGDAGFVLTTNDPITVGTTALVFTQFSGAGQITAGSGLTKSGNTINAVGTSDKIDVSADAITISSTYIGQTSITTLSTVTAGTWAATDVAVAHGGTGSSTASGARTNLGVAIGSDVQGYDADLAAIAALASSDSNFIVGSAGGWVVESGATVRTSLGAQATITFGTGVETFLGTPSSANLATAITDETGSGLLVFATSPTLVTPVLGTPASGTLTNCTFPTLNQSTSGTAAIATTVTVADESSDSTCFPLFVTAATGNVGPKSGTNLTFASDTGILTATGFAGPLTGNVTGDASGSSGSCTGNAATVTTNANLTGHITSTGNAAILGSFTVAQLSTALSDASISGSNTGDQTTVSGSSGSCTGNAATATLATDATSITVSANNTAAETVYPLFVDGATGSQGAETDTGLTYNPNTGLLTSTLFAGDITGDVTGNADTVTTNANLTGHITSVGNAAVLGSFSSAQLSTAVSDETGTGVLVFATSPTLVTPLLGTPTSGTLTNCTFPTLNQSTSGTAAIATTVTVADESTDATCFPLFVTAATGNLAPKSGTNLSFASNTGILTATGIACDSIIVDVATAGLDIVFGGNTTLNKMTLTDNLADALNVTEGSNSYMKFVTTNSGESIVTAKNLVQQPDMTNTALTSQSGSVVINANLGNYFTVATTGAITGLDIQNAVVGQKIVIRFAWGGTHSIAYTDTVIWPGGIAATVTASGVDTLGFICTTASSAFDAFIIGLDIKAA